MQSKRLTILLLLLCVWYTGNAQTGFYLTNGKKRADIPFEFVNNFIVITLNFNGKLPLRFIYDTGAEHTILNKREIGDFLGLEYEREFRVAGSDLREELVAYLSRNIVLEIPGKVRTGKEDILVLEEDYFHFEEYAGVNVDGILAGHIFSQYVVHINYNLHFITLYERKHFKLPQSGFTEIPVEIFRNKMYFYTQLEQGDSIIPVKLLLDSGAALPLLLFSDTHPLLTPPPTAVPSNIGMGLGGFLEGFTGRINRLQLGDLQQDGVLSYFQTLDSLIDAPYINRRNGLIGNALLNRFELIMDYNQSKIWLKPGRNYNKAFLYDRSGITVIATGQRFNVFIVQHVLPGSPADLAGIKKGDELFRLNLLRAKSITLSDVLRILQKKPGKKVRITVLREGKKLHKTLVLRDLI